MSYLEVFSGVHFNTTDQHKDLRPTSTARDGIHYTSFKDYLAQHSPFIYKGEYMDRLVCISTGIVDPATANADRANKPGELAANQHTGKNYANVKLERNDKVISIGVATNGAEVRGCQVEIGPLSLFLRATCVLRRRDGMKVHLTYEFSKHPSSLFDSVVMRKSNSSVLANALKSYVNPVHAIQYALHVADGGHLLHSVMWPKNCTYDDVINNYVSYGVTNYGNVAIVCFDLLVMLIDRSSKFVNAIFKLLTIYSTHSIRDALPSDVRDHLLAAHAITGCDIVLAMYKIGKNSSSCFGKQWKQFPWYIFKENEATHDRNVFIETI